MSWSNIDYVRTMPTLSMSTRVPERFRQAPLQTAYPLTAKLDERLVF